MGKAATTQTLSYPLRLPDEAQEDALRLLDVSREVINTVIRSLWSRLDEFGVTTLYNVEKSNSEEKHNAMPKLPCCLFGG